MCVCRRFVSSLVGHALSTVLPPVCVCVCASSISSHTKMEGLSEIVKCVHGCGTSRLKKQNHDLHPELSGSRVSAD